LESGIIDVGRYRLIAELAHGGMGDVYLGVARGPAGFNKLMVIKQLRPALADDEQFLAMFLEEARLAARLNHPNVVQTVEVGNEGRRYFLAMEYLEGQSLQRIRQRLMKDRPFPLGPHIRILIETLNGLHYAHELVDIDNNPLGVVHRDATPHNVFVTYDGQVKVVDFGIAKAIDSSLETRTGELKGKVAYMPPEQAAAKRVDRRADIFAVGVMLWEAVTNRRLWKGMNEIAIMHNLFTGQIPAPRDVDPRVPEDLDRICRIAMAIEPDYRYASAAEMAQELERFLATVGDRTTSKDIGKLVTDAFEDDRREMREIIDGQLRLLRTSQAMERASTQIPKPDLVNLTQSPDAASGSAPNASMPRVSTAQLDASAPPSFTTGGTSTSMKPMLQPKPPSRAPLIVGIAMGAAALGLAAIVAVVLLNKNAPSKQTEPEILAATAPTATATTPATPNVARTNVSFSASPGEAKIYIDDAPLDQNPFNGAFPKDGLSHRVKVEANGYVTKTEVVVFNQDSVSLNVTLNKRPPGYVAPPVTKPTVTAAASASAAPEPTSSGHKKPHRDIDTTLGN
jgi:serine/threonine-protein kinase